ncbi:hypothetical protein ACGFZP_35045 [Kitasatospora sp. NPDC048239]|uniref:hypothetical protein n=1 Tax=Kitasatospora sp. NPDC048239 TaxID=3364046 RepID=UPI00371166DB
MSDGGEWWRKRGPWSGPGGGAAGGGAAGGGAAGGGEAADEDSVYASGAPGVSGMPPVAPPPRPAADPEALPPPQVYTSADSGGWDLVMLNFSDTPQAPPKPIPEQRAAEEGAPAAEAAVEEVPAAAGAAKADRAGQAAARAAERMAARAAAKAERRSARGARRPSPLLLLSAAVLVGGAVTGQILAMLVGWALGYLSRQLTDFMRKFAILGIPLVTMSATTVWFWGRAQGRWGQALQPDQQVGQVAWSAAPGVLKVSAVLSAVFLFVVAMRRRAPQEG